MSVSIPMPTMAIQGAARGVAVPGSFGVSAGTFSFPTDPIGTFALTLTHLVVGSAIQIEAAGDGTVFANLVADTTSETINLSAYAAGSPNNDLKIKVRKGSAAPFYQPYETQATAIVGAQSIYVSQIPDE